MTRTKVGLAAALLILVTACTSTDQTTSPSTTPVLPPAGSIDPDYAAKVSSEAAAASSRASSSTEETSAPLTAGPAPTSTQTSSVESSSQASVVSVGFDPSVGQGTFTIVLSDSIPESERPLAQQAAELARDSLVLTDQLNQDLARSDLDEYLDDFYYGNLLAERSSTVQSMRAVGRTQQGWFGGTLTVSEVGGGTARIEACLDVSGVDLRDAAGTNIPQVADTIYGLFGVTIYDAGLRIGHLEFAQIEGTLCE